MQSEIDMAAADKLCRVFDEDFCVELFFSDPVKSKIETFKKVPPPSFKVLELTRKQRMEYELSHSSVPHGIVPTAVKAFRNGQNLFGESKRSVTVLLKTCHIVYCS